MIFRFQFLSGLKIRYVNVSSSLDHILIATTMKNLIAVSLALLVGFTQAACPNQCSGHGTCGVDEVVRRL